MSTQAKKTEPEPNLPGNTNPATNTSASEKNSDGKWIHPGLGIPFALLVACFAAWGMATDITAPMVKVFGSVFSMSAFESSLVQFAYYGAYFLLALPAAWISSRLGYKGGVMIGLALAAAGGFLFWPASNIMTFGAFILALFTLAAGLSILETSANPFIMAMGPAHNATRRLNFAQAFNPIGSNLGVLVATVFILPYISTATHAERAAMSESQLLATQSAELQAVMGPYIGLATLYLMLCIFIGLAKVPKRKGLTSDKASGVVKQPGSRFWRLLSNKRYSFGVVAQFFNISAQTCIWTFTLHYVTETLGVDNKSGGYWLQASLIMFLVFRFIMVALMGRIDSRYLMITMCVSGIVLAAVAVSLGTIVGAICVALLSACISLLFPTIYGLALEGLGSDTKYGAAGLVMAIVGGALMPPVQGKLIDATSAQFSFIIPLICFAIIAAYGWYTLKVPAPTPGGDQDAQ